MRGIPFPKKLFMVWFQGWDRTPEVVTHCRRSWEYHNPTWEIHLLDKDNLSDYIDLDDFSYLHEILPPSELSDIVRIHLLERYGGVWADATCFCGRPLEGYLDGYLDSGFFAFSRPGQDRMISSWFLAAAPGNRLVETYCRATRAYWLKNPNLRPAAWDDRWIDACRRVAPGYWSKVPNWLRKPDDVLWLFKSRYVQEILLKRPWLWHTFLFTKILKRYPNYWFHYLFEYCYRNDRSFQETWNATPKVSADIPHRLQHAGLLRSIPDQIRQEIDDRMAPLYKLTWKLDDENIPKGSILDYLKSTVPGEDRSQEAEHRKYYVTRSDTNRMIYFINPKCASTTIKAFLAATDPILDVDSTKIGQNGAFGKVDRIEDISLYPEYFKFTFVRNPWDRLVSCYLEKVTGQRRWPDVFGSSPSFADFVRVVHRIPDEEADIHYQSQYLNVTDDAGKLAVDFVGRVENIQDDIKRIASVRNLECSLENFRKSEGRRPYQEYYDEETKDLAGQRYTMDIELFGYEF